jgi:predicted MFS family arabinose efflux permease
LFILSLPYHIAGGQKAVGQADGNSLMVDHAGQTTSQRRIPVVLLLVAQLVVASVLAPCDGGAWLENTLLWLWAFDIAACLVLYLIARLRKDRAPGISGLAALAIVVGSLVVAVAGTYARDSFNLLDFLLRLTGRAG